MTADQAGGAAGAPARDDTRQVADPPHSRGEHRAVIRLGNEFSEVEVEVVRTRNGSRLRISVPGSGAEVSLCPLELEALTWQDPDFFSQLLATPHGPEADG